MGIQGYIIYKKNVNFPFNLPSSFHLYIIHGFSRTFLQIQVTWVEHAEIEEKPVHQIFSHFVYNGLAFGAHRWLAVLERQCERIASLMARNITDLGGLACKPTPTFF